MVTACFELVTIQPQPQQPATHTVLLVISHTPAATGFLLAQCLMTQRQTELNVRLNFACVRGAVEKAKLDGTFCKCSMKIQHIMCSYT